jgi:hypothetical protein
MRRKAIAGTRPGMTRRGLASAGLATPSVSLFAISGHPTRRMAAELHLWEAGVKRLLADAYEKET